MKKCPKCDLNYIDDGDDECSICKNVNLERPLRPPSSGKIEIDEKVMLIRINQTYSMGISAQALYDVTRGVWKVGAKRDRVDFAFAVYAGIICEVYEINYWEPATRYSKFLQQWDGCIEGRWQFVGKPCERLHEKYVGKDISEYFSRGNANPIMYVNV